MHPSYSSARPFTRPAQTHPLQAFTCRHPACRREASSSRSPTGGSPPGQALSGSVLRMAATRTCPPPGSNELQVNARVVGARGDSHGTQAVGRRCETRMCCYLFTSSSAPPRPLPAVPRLRRHTLPLVDSRRQAPRHARSSLRRDRWRTVGPGIKRGANWCGSRVVVGTMGEAMGISPQAAGYAAPNRQPRGP